MLPETSIPGLAAGARAVLTPASQVVQRGPVEQRAYLAAAEAAQRREDAILISRAARRRVKVALSGLGGDELFGGYPHFVTLARAARLR